MQGVYVVPMDEESIEAVQATEAALVALRSWRDNTCFDIPRSSLKVRVIESCTCPVCVAIRALEQVPGHIERIFE